MIGGVIIHIKPAKALLHSWLSRVILGPGGAQQAGQDLLCGPTCCLAPGDSSYTPRNKTEMLRVSFLWKPDTAACRSKAFPPGFQM